MGEWETGRVGEFEIWKRFGGADGDRQKLNVFYSRLSPQDSALLLHRPALVDELDAQTLVSVGTRPLIPQ